MKKSMVAALIGLAVGLGSVSNSQAEENARSWNWSPLGIGIAAPLQLPFMDSDIYGMRMGGLFAFNNDVYGLDVGLVGVSAGYVSGLQVAGYTWTEGDFNGMRLGAIANVTLGSVYGIDVGLVNVAYGEVWGLQFGGINYASGFCGIQFAGSVNWNESLSAGCQVAPVNADQDDFEGISIGLVNYANTFAGCAVGLVNVSNDVVGFQLGLFNACTRMHGMQIGLLNVIETSPRLPIMVIANAMF